MKLRSVISKKNKKAQTAFEDIFYVMGYLFFAGILFFIVYFTWGQIKPEINTALGNNIPSDEGTDPLKSGFNVSKVTGQTAGGLGLFNTLYPLILVGLIIMTLVSASFMGSHPVFFFVSLIVLGVVVILGVVISNVYVQITDAPEFGNTTDSFNIQGVFMKYLPFILIIIVIIVFVVIYASGGSSKGI